MEPTLGELARRLDELGRDTRECRDLLRALEDRLDQRYVRQETFHERAHTTDIQIDGIEATLHSHGRRLDAHDEAHRAEQNSRDASRRAFLVAVTAAILSPLISSLILVYH